ncbi:MAG: sulfatase, partial [bacterium]
MSISTEDKKKIIKQYPKSSISELSRELGVSRRAVKKVLQEKEQARARMKKRAVLLALVLAVAAGAAGGAVYYVQTLPPPAADPEERNLLIVSIDTCRADRLGCYGYGNAKTPVIDSIAAQGVKMERAYAIQPITLPSHATILTGLHSFNHGVRDNGLYKLPREAVTMAEVLREKGYLTGAIISAFVLNEQFGLSQGFEHYDDRLSKEPTKSSGIAEIQASLVSERAVNWIEKNANKKWFLWLHYFDPHAPYVPPEKFKDATGDPYDGEIAYVDHELERVMNLLDRKNLRRKTVVIITSDHGEGLGEHEEATHGIFLYNSTMHVPMI